MVGQRTIGLSLSTGRGATAAALERRALRRLSLRPGYKSVLESSFEAAFHRTDRSSSQRVSVYVPGRSGREPDAANPCGNLSINSQHLCSSMRAISSMMVLRLCGICWLCLMAILVVSSRRRCRGGRCRKVSSQEEGNHGGSHKFVKSRCVCALSENCSMHGLSGSLEGIGKNFTCCFKRTGPKLHISSKRRCQITWRLARAIVQIRALIFFH
jgi:hypothetical protein